MAEVWQTFLQMSKGALESANLFNTEIAKMKDTNEDPPLKPAILSEVEEKEFLYCLEFDAPPRTNPLLLNSLPAEILSSFNKNLEAWSHQRNKSASPSSSSSSSFSNTCHDTTSKDSSDEESESDRMSCVPDDVPLILTKKLKKMRRATSESPATSSQRGGSPVGGAGTSCGEQRRSITNLGRSESFVLSSSKSLSKFQKVSAFKEPTRKNSQFSLTGSFRKIFNRRKDSLSDGKKSHCTGDALKGPGPSNTVGRDFTSDGAMSACVTDFDRKKGGEPCFYNCDQTHVLEPLDTNIEYKLLSEISCEDREEQQTVVGLDVTDSKNDWQNWRIANRVSNLIDGKRRDSTHELCEVAFFDCERSEVTLMVGAPTSSCGGDTILDCINTFLDGGHNFTLSSPIVSGEGCNSSTKPIVACKTSKMMETEV